MLRPSGERYHPEDEDPVIGYEHWHRYLYASRFVKGRTVLDIACGEGYGSHLLSLAAARVVGVDRNHEVVQHAARRYRRPNLRFVVGTADRIPLNAHTHFDVVTSFETIEHLSEPDQRAFLEEVKRVLCRDGVFIVSTPNKLLYADRRRHQNPFHAREFYVPEFEILLREYFYAVTLLGQRVYPVSYIWSPQAHPVFDEHTLEWTPDGFRPTAAAMEAMYVIALCSEHRVPDLDASVLVDISEAIFRRAESAIQVLHTQVDASRRQLEAIIQSKSWRLTAPMRLVWSSMKRWRRRIAGGDTTVVGQHDG